MRRLKDYGDVEKQAAILELRKAMKATKDLRMHQRYQVILLTFQGKTQREIAEITNVSEATINVYVGAYKDRGLAGLVRKHPPGAPAKLKPEQERLLHDVITKSTPKDVGFGPEMNWTSPLIRAYIEKTFGVQYSDRGTRNLLDRLGFSYTKPTYVLAKADPEKQEDFLRDFDDLKKN